MLEVVLFQKLVDDVLVPATLGPLVWIAAMYVGLNLLSAVISGVDDYLSTWISQKFLVGLRTKVFGHVLAHPSHVHERSRLGDMMSRLTSDTAAVERFMIGQFATGAAAVIRLVIYTGALFWLQRELALAALVAAPLFWWVATRFARFVKAVSRSAAAAPARWARSPRSGGPPRPGADLQPRAPGGRGVPPAEPAIASGADGSQPGALGLHARRRPRRAARHPLRDRSRHLGPLDRPADPGRAARVPDPDGPVLPAHPRARRTRRLRMFSATAGIERVAELLAERPVEQASRRARPHQPPRQRSGWTRVSVRYPGAHSRRPARRVTVTALRPGEAWAVMGA